jgi:exonuclease SbcC
MRPHRLEVTAFGAFAGTAAVSFDELEGLFLLHGETGAGKTTLLDAIAFALYGRVPGERGKTRRLRSDHAPAEVRTEVTLDATIGGRRLRITRSPEQDRPKKQGQGVTTERARVVLQEHAGLDEWETKSTRAGEADAEIADLMGMSAEQFFQVVLLPQGQFAQFLHADAETRARLLQKLFGTDRFRAVEEWLADRRRSTAAEVAAATDVVDRLVAQVAQAASVPVPDGPDASLTWATHLADTATVTTREAATLVAGRERELDAALAAQRSAETLADKQRRRSEALRRQVRITQAADEIARLRAELDAANRAAEVAPVLAEVGRAAQALAAAHGAEQSARRELPEELRQRDAQSLRAAARERQERLGSLEGLRSEADRAAAEERAAATAGQRASTLAAQLEATSCEAEQLRGRRPEVVAARDEAQRAAAQLAAARGEATRYRGAATDSAALAKARGDRDRLHIAHLSARERAVELRQEALRIREARIDGMRAELAASLADGAPCPVCGSLDHPELCELTGEPVSREQETEATFAADQASDAVDKAGQKVAAAEALIGELSQRLADARFAGPRDTEPEDADSRDGAQSQGSLDAEATRLEAEAARLAAAADGLADRQGRLDELDAAISAADRSAVELTEQRTAARSEAEAAAERAASARDSLHAQLGGAPDLDSALAATRQVADALGAAADAADDVVRAEADDRRRQEEAAAAAVGKGFAGVVGTGPVEAAHAAQRDERWRGATGDRIAQYESASVAVAQQLADPELDVPLEPAAPVADAADAVARSRAAHEAAVAIEGRARDRAEQLAALLPRLTQAHDDREPLRARAAEVRRLADLAAGQGANTLRMTLSSFVLAARLEEVAEAASQRLLKMTAGRYSLVHTDARRGGGRAGLGLLACDSWTGVDRDTSTLSGGETFLASLALALGLADAVTAEAAGTPMEALFVDEGFGTLDEDTLDEVMNVLDGLREGGRIVGIVSHVAELRQRIPAQIHVRKGHHGSQVSVTLG